MSKLKRDEIENALEQEGVVPDIPYEARSKFTFNIEESVSELAEQITRKHSPKYAPEERHIDAESGEVFFTGGRHESKDNERRVDINTGETYYSTGGDDIAFKPWDLKGANGKYQLWDTDFDCYASVSVEKGRMDIATAWSGFEYQISENKDGGSTVEFSGPLNALMNQNLLPNMTYINGTLEGKFVDDKGDLTPYMPIENYCILRAQKNRGKENEQDVYGAHINARFNNEIPAFKKWVDITATERKNNEAQRRFEKGEKLSDFVVERKIGVIRNRLSKNKEAVDDIKEGIAKTEESGYKHISRTPKEGVKTSAWMRKRQRED